MPADWVTSVQVALDARQTPLQIFFRDDDAGWDDQRLYALLDCFRAHQIPIDLAVIPQSISQNLADALLSRWLCNPLLLGLHQHGFSHSNHQLEGRKCEFGSSRNHEQQFRDLLAGKQQLEQLLGSALDKIFTPPWNRCSQVTADSLMQLGFLALSRNVGAAAINVGALQEIPVAIDWCGIKTKSAQPWPAISQAVTEYLQQEHPEPLGIMLHHAVMDNDDLDHLQTLLKLLYQHPKADCLLMREFLSTSADNLNTRSLDSMTIRS